MDPSFPITELDEARLPEALALVWRVFLEFEAPDYTEEGVQEFRGTIAEENVRTKIAAGEMKLWACTHEGSIVGVIAVRPVCHICLLFVDGAFHRRGIARALLDQVLAFCKKSGSCGEITVNSSPYAVEIYRRLGFILTGDEQLVNGIRFWPMQRPLLDP